MLKKIFDYVSDLRTVLSEKAYERAERNYIRQRLKTERELKSKLNIPELSNEFNTRHENATNEE